MSVTSADKNRPGGSIIATSYMAGVAGVVSDISYCKCRPANIFLAFYCY